MGPPNSMMGSDGLGGHHRNGWAEQQWLDRRGTMVGLSVSQSVSQWVGVWMGGWVGGYGWCAHNNYNSTHNLRPAVLGGGSSNGRKTAAYVPIGQSRGCRSVSRPFSQCLINYKSIYKSHSQPADRSVNMRASPSFAAVATKQTTRTKKMNCGRCDSLPHVPCGTVCGASRHGEGRRAGWRGGTYYGVVETTQKVKLEAPFPFTSPLLPSTRH